MRARLRLTAALALCAAALAGTGCGGSDESTVTRVETVEAPASTPEQTTATVPRIGGPDTGEPADTPPESTPPAETGGTRDDAVARMRDEGYRPDDLRDYRPSQTLRVLVGTRLDSGDGHAKRAFFFVGDDYLGTDTSDDSAAVMIEEQSDTSVTVAYGIFREGDPLCCPGSVERVRYEWNGSRLVPLDPIPPRTDRG